MLQEILVILIGGPIAVAISLMVVGMMGGILWGLFKVFAAPFVLLGIIAADKFEEKRKDKEDDAG